MTRADLFSLLLQEFPDLFFCVLAHEPGVVRVVVATQAGERVQEATLNAVCGVCQEHMPICLTVDVRHPWGPRRAPLPES